MPKHYVKLKGVIKLRSNHSFDLYDAMIKLLLKNGRNFFVAGNYKVSLATKVGKRWKLKSRKVEVYNKFPCECCGPYYVAELVA
jgi:hypothetical protein